VRSREVSSSIMDKKGGFVNRPPMLDGSNYDYWKSRMSAFLKSIDNKTWKAVLKGWEHHVVLDADGNMTTFLKPEEGLILKMNWHLETPKH